MDNFVICGGTITLVALFFGFIIILRYMGYHETLALAEKGLIKPEKRNGKGALVWGVSFTAVGAALCLGLLPLGFWIGNTGRFGPLGIMGPWLLAGLLPMFFGLGLILTYVLTREPKPRDEAGSAVAVATPAPASPALKDVTQAEPPASQY